MPPPVEGAPQHAALQGTTDLQQPQLQSTSSSFQQAGSEANSISPVAAPLPRQRSLRHPKSPRSPAAQRRANARAKPDAAGAQSIRRLGAEPMGRTDSMSRHSASLPAAPPDGGEGPKLRNRPPFGSSPRPSENGDAHSTMLDSSPMQQELQPDITSAAIHKSLNSAIR